MSSSRVHPHPFHVGCGPVWWALRGPRYEPLLVCPMRRRLTRSKRIVALSSEGVWISSPEKPEKRGECDREALLEVVQVAGGRDRPRVEEGGNVRV